MAKRSGFYYQMVKCILEAEGVDEDLPLKKWPKKLRKTIFEGSSKEYTYNFESENSKYTFKKAFPGIETWLEKKYNETGLFQPKRGYMHV